MLRKTLIMAATALALTAMPALAKTLRYANQGDLKSLDPYTLNETTTNAHLGNVYELRAYVLHRRRRHQHHEQVIETEQLDEPLNLPL